MFRYLRSRDSSLINNSRGVDSVHGFMGLHPQVHSPPSSVFVRNGSEVVVLLLLLRTMGWGFPANISARIWCERAV